MPFNGFALYKINKDNKPKVMVNKEHVSRKPFNPGKIMHIDRRGGFHGKRNETHPARVGFTKSEIECALLMTRVPISLPISPMATR